MRDDQVLTLCHVAVYVLYVGQYTAELCTWHVVMTDRISPFISHQIVNVDLAKN